MFNKRLITLVPLLALSACMHQADNPRDVASRYWQAMKAGDTASARELVSRVSQQDFDSYLAIPDEGKTAYWRHQAGRRTGHGRHHPARRKTAHRRTTHRKSTQPVTSVPLIPCWYWKTAPGRSMPPRQPYHDPRPAIVNSTNSPTSYPNPWRKISKPSKTR